MSDKFEKVTAWHCGNPNCHIYHLSEEDAVKCASFGPFSVYRCNNCGRVTASSFHAEHCCDVAFWETSLEGFVLEMDKCSGEKFRWYKSRIEFAKKHLQHARENTGCPK